MTRTGTRSRSSGTSTTARPRRPARSTSHIYAAGGTYNVKVTATDGKGGTTTETIAVTVSPKANVLPTVDVLADPGQGTAPLVVRFCSQVGDQDGHVNNLGYMWAFGDGAFSAEKNPVHTYPAAGVYTASLTVDGRARRQDHEDGPRSRSRRSPAALPRRRPRTRLRSRRLVRRQRAGQDLGQRVRQERPDGQGHGHRRR